MSKDGYVFDQSTDEHRLTVTEQVPNWWLRKEGRAYLLCIVFIVWAVGAFATQATATGVICIGLIGYVVWRYGGFQNEFTTVVTANETSGLIVVDSGFRRRNRKLTPHRFNVWEVASVERSSYAEEYPDAIAYMQAKRDEGTNAADLAKARDFAVVRIVFRDGQEINAIWQCGHNNAAQLQSALIELFSRVQRRVGERQRQQQLMQAIPAGDAPL